MSNDGKGCGKTGNAALNKTKPSNLLDDFLSRHNSNKAYAHIVQCPQINTNPLLHWLSKFLLPTSYTVERSFAIKEN